MDINTIAQPEVLDSHANQTDEIEKQSSAPTELGLEEALDLEGLVEAVIFATPEPLQLPEIVEILQDEAVTTRMVSEILERLIAVHMHRGGGFRLVHLQGLGYQFQTVKAAGHVMKRMFSNRPRPLSRAAQETLAIVAYRQPVTRSDIEFIRGVDAGSILKNLLERKLIACIGRREIAGRPMMFGTTSEFLNVYQISELADLPPIEAFQPSQEVVKKALGKLEMADDEIDDLLLGALPGNPENDGTTNAVESDPVNSHPLL